MSSPIKFLAHAVACTVFILQIATLLYRPTATAIAVGDEDSNRMLQLTWLPGIRQVGGSGQGRAQEEVRLGPLEPGQVEPGDQPPQPQPLIGTPVVSGESEAGDILNSSDPLSSTASATSFIDPPPLYCSGHEE